MNEREKTIIKMVSEKNEEDAILTALEVLKEFLHKLDEENNILENAPE